MSKKLYYSVARGVRPGIYTLWSKCELNVHKYPHAVFKGFHNIEQAIAFLIAGNAFQHCHSIPVIDDTEITKHPKDFDHKCIDPPCSVENIDISIINDANNNCNKPITESQGQLESDQSLIHAIDTETTNTQEFPTSIETTHTQEISETEDTDPKILISNSESLNQITCTQQCNDGQNAYMIQCCKCQKLTHYRCTRLPVYQLYILTSTSRRYTCEKCTTVPTSFVEKCNISSNEIKEGEQNTKVENEHMLTNSVSTFEILERIENSVVCAITKTHEKNQDEMIIKLKSDLQNERDKKEDLKEISGKIDEIKSAISTTCISVKSETCKSISEGYEKISTKTTNQIKDFTEKLNRNITETISQTLQSKIDPLIDNMRKISENSVSVTKSLETTGTVLSDNTVTNREITKTLENLAKLNYSDKKQHPRELGSVDEMSQNTEASYTPNIQVTNRYLSLAERIPNPHSEEKHVTNNQHSHDNKATKKALILGNSHIDI